MIDFHDLLTHDAVRADVPVANRKALLARIAATFVDVYGGDAKRVADALAARERCGSTGFGNGTALPHARVDTLDRVGGIFLRTARPVAFDAVDDLPVDLVFALFSPPDAGGAHLKALARVSRALRDADVRAKLRGAGSPDALYALLAGVETRGAA